MVIQSNKVTLHKIIVTLTSLDEKSTYLEYNIQEMTKQIKITMMFINKTIFTQY